MKLSFFNFLAFAILIFSSCGKEAEVSMTDTELIQAIQSANDKENIDAEALPSDASDVIESDFSESYTEAAQLARGLGYEVKIRRGEGAYIGERNEVYFNLKGRELGRDLKDIKRGEHGCDRKECFQIIFPVTFIMPDGSEITGENKMEIRTAIKAWYEANPDVEEKPELQFPLEIEYEDGTILSISDELELREAYAECKGDKMRDKCFELVFPLTFLMPDGTTISGENWEEIKPAIRAWYEANPNADEKPGLQFPVDIVYEDGTTETVNSKEEMIAAYKDCE